MKFVTDWEDIRHDLPFNTDGAVVKLNDRRLYAQLGVVGKAPRAQPLPTDLMLSTRGEMDPGSKCRDDILVF